MRAACSHITFLSAVNLVVPHLSPSSQPLPFDPPLPSGRALSVVPKLRHNSDHYVAWSKSSTTGPSPGGSGGRPGSPVAGERLADRPSEPRCAVSPARGPGPPKVAAHSPFQPVGIGRPCGQDFQTRLPCIREPAKPASAPANLASRALATIDSAPFGPSDSGEGGSRRLVRHRLDWCVPLYACNARFAAADGYETQLSSFRLSMVFKFQESAAHFSN